MNLLPPVSQPVSQAASQPPHPHTAVRLRGTQDLIGAARSSAGRTGRTLVYSLVLPSLALLFFFFWKSFCFFLPAAHLSKEVFYFFFYLLFFLSLSLSPGKLVFIRRFSLMVREHGVKLWFLSRKRRCTAAAAVAAAAAAPVAGR